MKTTFEKAGLKGEVPYDELGRMLYEEATDGWFLGCQLELGRLSG